MVYKIVKQGFDDIISYKSQRQSSSDFIIKINRVFDGIEKADVEFINKLSNFKYDKTNANILKNIIYNKQDGCCIVTNEKISFEEGTLHHILPRYYYPNKTFLIDNCVFIKTDIESLYHKIYRDNINLNSLVNFIYRYRTNQLIS